MGDDCDDRSDEVREGWGLLIPFVACQSNDGPYEDQSFVAGYQAGVLFGKLEGRTIAATTAIFYTPMKHQADLIAMHHGYTMDVLNETDEWLHLGFTRVDADLRREEPTDGR